MDLAKVVILLFQENRKGMRELKALFITRKSQKIILKMNKLRIFYSLLLKAQRKSYEL